MKLLYIGCFCESSQMPFINKHKAHITISATTFQKAFLSGFDSTKLKPDYIVNVPDLGSFPLRCNTPFFKSSAFEFCSIKGKNCHFLNLTIVKRYSIYRSILKEAKLWMRKNANEEKIILVYSLIPSYLKAAIKLKRLFKGTRVCCIVLDLPEFFGDNTSLIHKWCDKKRSIDVYSLVPEIDMFVLLTEYMVQKLNVGERPWILMEGIYNPVGIEGQNKERKTILYSGKLDARFGIRSLLEAFHLIDDSNFSLWICGEGMEREYVEQAVSKDSRIKYWGVLNQQEVFVLQRRASLLINPRKPEGEYTKYSFPSKTMEYMASGTPTIMYELPGLPKEYVPYLIIIPDNTVETLRNILFEYGCKNQNELEQIGNRAKQFILTKKTSSRQIERFVHFVENVDR